MYMHLCIWSSGNHGGLVAESAVDMKILERFFIEGKVLGQKKKVF